MICMQMKNAPSPVESIPQPRQRRDAYNMIEGTPTQQPCLSIQLHYSWRIVSHTLFISLLVIGIKRLHDGDVKRWPLLLQGEP